MVSLKPQLRYFWNLLTLVVLLSPLASPWAIYRPELASAAPLPADKMPPTAEAPFDAWTDLFRAWVTLPNSTSRARLDSLEVVVLEETEMQVLILADAEQLETLARLRFRPEATDDLGMLVERHAEAVPWLAQSLQPLLVQAGEVRMLSLAADGGTPAATPSLQQSQMDLRTALQALTAEQQAGIMSLTNIDSDGDGLTDTQEAWWCTDSMNVDSDGDGASDADEVQAAKDWLNNLRAGPPATGKPFAGWPPQISGCRDDDMDSVPDLAERWELGLNMNRESTDRDKFDDGQELFGNTYCPGSGGFCGYGALPRNEDWGVIFAEMPSWVKAPGNHPLIAAFPVPGIDVVPSSLHVETVTTVTTDHTISSGTERSYSTAKTEGVSTGVANTEMWNEWQETSIATPQGYLNHLGQSSYFPTSGGTNTLKYIGHGLTIMGGIGAVACTVATGGLCLPLAVAGLAGATLAFGADALEDADSTQQMLQANRCDPGAAYMTPACLETRLSELPDQVAIDQQFQTAQCQDLVKGGSGTNYSINSRGNTIGQSVYQMTYLQQRQQVVKTATSGRSWGGSQTTTNTQYEEHTITNGEAFSSGESWGTATAVDSSHAADLWFTYVVSNTGTEYAREIGDLAFNIYIGDDPNPAYTYFVAPDLGGDGKFHNFMPDEEHTYTSRRIPLTLNQMAAVDLGGPVRIVVEDFTYGIDELFYQDAVNAGVLIALEDGMDDGDEAIDTYLIPTWDEETVMDVLARYFPHTLDAYGNLIAIWTPEYRADTPAWCNEPRVIGSGSRRAVWCKKALSTADWWNIYTNGMGDGSEGFQDTLASQGSMALFRFNQDSDLDGYSDRSELRLGTDPNDAASYPRPELLAGVHSVRVGNYVTATLSLLNTGVYDAYGIEAIMIAPNDTVSITNNTVGGSGRVRAQREVVVGSRIVPQTPLPVQWTQTGHAQPTAGGYYTDSRDRIYTFTVQCSNPGGCDVSAGTWTLSWNDGVGSSGALNFGTGYASPNLLSVGTYGLEIGLLSGRVFNGEAFTVEARTPRDTFQYAINAEPFTPPVVVVSYNDPQGNHRFIIPPEAMALSSPSADLAPFAGQMLQDPGVEIVTTEVFTPGLNTTNLVVNNPTGVTLTDAHLFMEFVNISGTVASEVPVTATLPAGPSVVPVAWNTDAFSPTFQIDEDYIVLAFLTDWQGDILDTAGRPLSSFQKDPKPALAMSVAETVWDFGDAVQGTVLKRTFDLANTGYLDLLTYVNAPAGVTLSQQGSRSVGPADVTTYEITLDTAGLPVGSYSETVTIRSSDSAIPTQTVILAGNIIVAAPDVPVGALQRPLDWPITVASGTQGQWIQYTHTLGPTPQTLHPVKVYSQDFSTFWGVGRYVIPSGSDMKFRDMFGDGRDGLMPSSGNLDNTNGFGAGIVNSGSVGSNNINVTDAYGVWRINQGDVVLIHQTQGANAGCWEINRAVSDFVGGTATYQLLQPLRCNYASNTTNHAQILRVPQYTNCQVSGTVTPLSEWNGSWGGIFAVMCNEAMNLTGSVSGVGYGFRGGARGQYPTYAYGGQGESFNQLGSYNYVANGGGGGGGQGDYGSCGGDMACVGSGGGGGGHGTNGANGLSDGGTPRQPGLGGSTYGSGDLSSVIHFGSGGGGGGPDNASNAPGGLGGDGGGMVFISAFSLTVSGTIKVDGANGQTQPGSDDASRSGGGGGGSGGAVILRGFNVNTGNGKVIALGGNGAPGNSNKGAPYGGTGGNGGSGRIRVEYCHTHLGTTTPESIPQVLDCHISEQVETSPYASGRLNVPETFSNGRTYQIQYGRRLVYGGTTAQEVYLRIPAVGFTDVKVDVLINEVGIGTRTFRLDVGNDGTWDWEWSGSVTNAITLNSPNLSAAFSRYWATHGTPTSGTLDVPIKVYLSQAGQVLLTNLQVTPTGSKMRYARLPAGTYSSVTLNLSVGTSGSGPLTVAADVGDDGSVDWTYTATGATYPLALTTNNLATAFNAYFAGHTGEVAVPVRFYVTPFVDVRLKNLSATPSTKPDLGLTASDITFGSSSPAESDLVPITVTLHNNGGLAATGHTVAFYATAPEWGEWYIGSAFVPGIPAGETAEASIVWDTLGFTDATPVRVVVDPYNRLAELDEDNNQATASLTVLTRPDLEPAFAASSNPEPVAGETVTVSLQVANYGQVTTGAFKVGLYSGNPDDGGELLQTADLTVPGGESLTTAFTWTPAQPGPQRLFAVVDEERVINESTRGNNLAWQDIYVGVAGPLLLDSGGSTDPAYSAVLGYGFVDEGPADVTGMCGAEPYQKYRLDANPLGGRVVYRFDHLLPGHFYHLDITLYKCSLASRQENILVNGQLVAGPIDLGDGQVHRLSVLLDPALYTGHTIRVEIETLGGSSALVNEVNLYDVDYRYADAGGASDPEYPGGALVNLGHPYGWLNGVKNIAWGTLPYKSTRVNPLDSLVEYRFDGLNPTKRYNVHLVFWQPSGTSRTQRVRLDGLNSGLTVNTGDYQIHRETLAIPTAAHATDGSVVVSVKRVDEMTDVILNEIALEEETLPRSDWCSVQPTPYFTDVYGNVAILGEDAPAGTVIEARNPRGETVGCFVVGTAGQYGFMRIYGEDTTATPPIPGMRAGELVEFRVSGAVAFAAPLLYWQADSSSHQVDLNAEATEEQVILLNPGWNLISIRVQPPVPTVERVLSSIEGRYDRVLGEYGAYVPGLPDVFNTLKELQPGRAYYIRITSPTAIVLLIEGLPIPTATPIPLHEGWNWTGYLPEATLPITVALQSIEGQYQRVLSLDSTYDPDFPSYSTLHSMEPGKGYQVYMNQAATLIYPETVGMLGIPLSVGSSSICNGVAPTPKFTLLHGELLLGNRPAPAGSRIEVLTPRGEIAGCFVLEKPGVVNFMHVYGEDDTAEPPIAGFRDGEPLAFRVNGMLVEAEPLIWHDDWTSHAVALQVDAIQVYLPLVIRNQ